MTQRRVNHKGRHSVAERDNAVTDIGGTGGPCFVQFDRSGQLQVAAYRVSRRGGGCGRVAGLL